MKYVLVALLLFAISPANAYTGFLLTSQDCSQNREPHWQCEGLWKAADDVLPTDYVATCPTMGVGTSCAVRLKWMLQTTILPDTYVQTCTGMPATRTNKGGCINPLFVWFEQEVPTPRVAPPCAPSAVCFFNVTTAAFERSLQVQMHFWSGFPDANMDGCLDVFIGEHGYNNSTLYLQDNEGGCAGTFTYIDPADSNYMQESLRLRTTSRYVWGNWYGNDEGLPSYYAHDADAPPSGRYVATGLDNGIPQYAPKTVGCPTSSCVPVDMDGDGVVELITRQRSDDNSRMAIISDTETGDTKLIPDMAGSAYGPIAVFDVDNNGSPEIVHPTNRGYWSYMGQELVWQGNKFPADGISPLAGSGHIVPLDYDNDGDMDLYFGAATYSGLTGNTVQGVIKGSNTFYVRMYRNDDGMFTDVTTEAGLLPGLIKNTTYWTGYSNTQAGDIDNDGDVDLVMSGESKGHSSSGSTITIIRNNGNGTFSIDRTNDFGAAVSITNNSARPWHNLGDWDNDGLLDLVKTHGASSPMHESVGLFQNTTSNGNHWLRIRVQGITSDGLHTRIVIRDAETGEIVGNNQIGAFTESYINLVPHFGLGNRTNVDVEIHRPHGGPVHIFEGVTADQDLLVRASGALEIYTPGTRITVEEGVVSQPISLVTTETSRVYYILFEGNASTEYATREEAEQTAVDILTQDGAAAVGITEVIQSKLEAK